MSNEDKAHRQIYEETFGPIPEGYHVHHIDSNHSNNDPTNLVALPAKVHRWLHGQWHRMRFHSAAYTNLARRGLISKEDLLKLSQLFDEKVIDPRSGFLYGYISMLKGDKNEND